MISLIDLLKELKPYLIGEPSLLEFAAALFFAFLLTLGMYSWRTSRPGYKEGPPMSVSVRFKGAFATGVFMYIAIRFWATWLEGLNIILAGVAVGFVSDQIGVFFVRVSSLIKKFIDKRFKSVEQKIEEVKEKTELIESKVDQINEKL